MTAPQTTRFPNCFQIIECTEERRCKRNWYPWIQFLFGTTGFMGFISYGSYIAPFYDLPVILACYFISLASLINSVLAVWKLRKAYKKRRNDVAAAKSSGDIELNLQRSSPENAENTTNNRIRSSSNNNKNNSSRISNYRNDSNSNRSNKNNSRSSNNKGKSLNNSSRRSSKNKNKSLPESSEEVDHLRKMLRQALPPHYMRIDAQYQPATFHQPKHHKTPRPYHPSWTNWEVHKFPGENTLRRTESYESSLRFHQRCKHSMRQLYAQDEAFCPSCSDHDTYVYSSSSDGAKTSSHGWKTTFTRKSPQGAPAEATDNLQIISHRVENIEHLEKNRTQFYQRPSRLPCDLPEHFPALPFPPRIDDVNRYRYRQGNKQFKLRDESTMNYRTRSRSVIDIDQCEHMSRKDVLKVLANFSPELIVPEKSKRSRKKHRVSRDTSKQQA